MAGRMKSKKYPPHLNEANKLDNDYGQPSPKALAQLAALGTTVLRTDLQGDAAVCITDGRLSTATRGASLPAGSSKGGGTADGS